MNVDYKFLIKNLIKRCCYIFNFLFIFEGREQEERVIKMKEIQYCHWGRGEQNEIQNAK